MDSDHPCQIHSSFNHILGKINIGGMATPGPAILSEQMTVTISLILPDVTDSTRFFPFSVTT